MAKTAQQEPRQRGCCQAVELGITPEATAGAAAVFKALADPARVQILATLARASGPVCVCDLTAALDLSQSTVSHHVAKLRGAGFVAVEKRGLWNHYALQAPLTGIHRQVLEAVLAAS